MDGVLDLLYVRRRLFEEGLLGSSAFTLDPLHVEVVLLEQRGQTGSDGAHFDRELIADLRRRLLEQGLFGDEVLVPIRPKSGGVGLIIALTTVELVHLPGPVGVAVGAVRARHRCKRGLIAVSAATAGQHRHCQDQQDHRGTEQWASARACTLHRHGRRFESHRAPPIENTSEPSPGGPVRSKGAGLERPARCPGQADVGCAKGTVSDRSARVARPNDRFSRWATPSTSRDRASPAAGRASTPRGSGFGPRSRRHAGARPPGRRPTASRVSRLPRRPAACRPG